MLCHEFSLCFPSREPCQRTIGQAVTVPPQPIETRRRICARCAFVRALRRQEWFNAQKGFGFIVHAATGKDVFVHISAVEHAGLSGMIIDR